LLKHKRTGSPEDYAQHGRYGDTSNPMQGGHPQAMKVAKFIVRRISIRDTEISAGVSQKLMEGGQAQLVGRSPTPFPALILLLRMKNHRRLRFSFRSEKAKMDHGSLSYKFLEPVPPRKNGPVFSRGFIRYSTGLNIVLMLEFTQSREIIAASRCCSAKQCSTSNQEATW
jgi:hypothetical protein